MKVKIWPYHKNDYDTKESVIKEFQSYQPAPGSAAFDEEFVLNSQYKIYWTTIKNLTPEQLNFLLSEAKELNKLKSGPIILRHYKILEK